MDMARYLIKVGEGAMRLLKLNAERVGESHVNGVLTALQSSRTPALLREIDHGGWSVVEIEGVDSYKVCGQYEGTMS